MPYNEIITVTPQYPTRVGRWLASLRSITLGPFNPKDKTIAKYFGGSPSYAGVSVTADNVLQYSPVWAAVNLIAGDLSGLPLMLYRRLYDGEKPAGKERYVAHPLYELIHDRPNPEMGSELFRETLQAHALIYGNGYAEIERGGPTGTQPTALWPLMPWQVAPIKEGNQPLYYRVWNPISNTYVDIAAANILHIRGLGTGVCGHDLVAQARQSLGLGIAAERFGATFYGNGTTFGGIVMADAIGDKAFKSLSDALKERHQGPEKAHRYLLLPGVKDVKPFGIPPEQGQFLETRQFQVEEVARWFGIAPYLLRRTEGTASYASTEQQRRDYYTVLYRWAKKWESEMQAKLVFPAERYIQTIEHVWESFLAADTQARGAFYTALFQLGAITPNEIRDRENLNPIDGGDQAFVQLNLVPLEKASEMAQAQIDKMTAQPAAAAPPPTDGDLADERAAHAETKRQLSEAREAQAVAERRLAASDAQILKAEDDLLRTRGKNADLTVDNDRLKEDVARLEGERLTRTQERDAAIGERDEAIQRAATADERAAVAHAEADAARKDAAAHDARAREAAEHQAHAEAQRDAAIADRATAEAEAERRLTDAAERESRLTQERDTARTAASTADGERAAIAAQFTEYKATHVECVSDYTKQVDALKADVATRETAIRALTAERDEAKESHAFEARARVQSVEREVRLTEERDSLRVALESSRAHAEERSAGERQALERAALATTQRDEAVAGEQAAEAEATKRADEAAAARAAQDTAEAAKTAAEATLRAERDAMAGRLTAVSTSHRAMVVDAVTRFVAIEADKARSNDTTPAKLANWTKRFYPQHEQACADRLVPVVASHLALVGSTQSPFVVAQTLAREHVRESLADLQVIWECDPPEEMAPALEALLTRWERHRPTALADRLMQDAITAVRNL